MATRKIIQGIIGFMAILWWPGFIWLELLNIFPFNNYVLYFATVGLIYSVVGLAVYDFVVYKSIEKTLDFWPAIEGEIPTISEWTSIETWKSLPKWFVACTTFWVVVNILFYPVFTIPNMEE